MHTLVYSGSSYGASCPVQNKFVGSKIILHCLHTDIVNVLEVWTVQTTATQTDQKIKWHNYVNVYPGVFSHESIKDMRCIANWEALAECCLWSIANQELIAQRSIIVCRSCHALSTVAVWHATLIPCLCQNNPGPTKLVRKTILLTLLKQFNRCIASYFISIE